MRYELQLQPLEAKLPTLAALREALDAAAATWQLVEGDDSVDAYLACSATLYGLEIMVLDDILSLSVPVAHVGQTAREAFDTLWQAGRCLQTLLPGPLFDPQLGRIISPENPFDVEKVLMIYAGLVRHLQSFDL